MEYAYYPGCSLKQSASPLDKQTRKVFEALGFKLTEIQDWNCCGATSASKTDDFLEVAMPARNIGIAESAGYSQMIIPCSACYSKTVVAKARMSQDRELQEDINSELQHKVRGDIKITSVLEPLYDLAASGELARRIERKLKGVVAACYYGCMLTRFPLDVPLRDDVENPGFMETILEAAGAQTVDWNMKTYCCGASAAVYDQEATLDLMAKIFKDALARDANCLVALCPVCQMNMDAYQETFCSRHGIEQRLPVYFVTELLGYALGLDDRQLQIERHFVDALRLIRGIERDQQGETQQ